MWKRILQVRTQCFIAHRGREPSDQLPHPSVQSLWLHLSIFKILHVLLKHLPVLYFQIPCEHRWVRKPYTLKKMAMTWLIPPSHPTPDVFIFNEVQESPLRLKWELFCVITKKDYFHLQQLITVFCATEGLNNFIKESTEAKN